ncbi:hypothetical protein BB561_001639 [Smittium simulii]|uniref:Protein root UVB sensitive/RUS domain-containing protein n=1 Tax=Smittium simulii TaxID=133385 RepID=A0A2T9YTU8_9FUNG|nr:hypothetical protein BB561_001639 [Smittium simulii]
MGSTASILSTQSMLFAIGLGSSAIPLSATLTWVLKDGIGQLGGVLYASFLGTNFDKESKRLKFWSAVWLQFAIWLEMLTPIFPAVFLLLASIANILKNICYLTLGATKASINKSLCNSDNLGDLTAKSGSQATAAGLAGTVLGIGLSSLFGADLTCLISVFVPLSCLAILANYKSLEHLKIQSLNLQHMALILHDLVKVNSGSLTLNKNSSMTHQHSSKYDDFVKKPPTYLKLNSSNLKINIAPNIKSIQNNTEHQDCIYNLNKSTNPTITKGRKMALSLKLNSLFDDHSATVDKLLYDIFMKTTENYYLFIQIIEIMLL